jgi:hypothetical protein
VSLLPKAIRRRVVGSVDQTDATFNFGRPDRRAYQNATGNPSCRSEVWYDHRVNSRPSGPLSLIGSRTVRYDPLRHIGVGFSYDF